MIEGYLAELVARLRAQTGDELVGVWLFGSAAAGDFDPARSDLDVQAVTRGRLPRDAREGLARAVAHEQLPVPVRGLELVVYARDEIPVPQLNLNTGPRMAWRLDLEPVPGEAFWFVLDVAIGRDVARALLGPPATEVFPALPREQVAQALRDLLGWFEAHDPGSPGATQAAARAWAWASDGRWRTKSEAARWAAGRAGPAEFAARAREALASG